MFTICSPFALTLHACSAGHLAVWDTFVDGVRVVDDLNFNAIRGLGSLSMESARRNVAGVQILEFTATQSTMTITQDDSDQVVPEGGARGEFPGITIIMLERLNSTESASRDVPKEHALRLVDDAYVQLPSMVLGESIAVDCLR